MHHILIKRHFKLVTFEEYNKVNAVSYISALSKRNTTDTEFLE